MNSTSAKINAYRIKSIHFFNYTYRLVKSQQLHVEAGYLSYVTIMSLVPLMVVMLSMMTAFPIFDEMRGTLETFVYSNFVPTTGEVVQEYVHGFVDNASKMSTIAISFLFLFALLLISSIDKTLNKIWGVSEKRRIVTSFSVYWMVLTLGPILVGSSVAITSYITSLISLGEYDIFGVTNFFLRSLPVIASVIAFFILYTVVPNKVVPFRYAILGAAVAALLFEFAKKAFAIYMLELPSYQAIYGALATIPILFLWVYLSWLVVLFGALFTMALESFEQHEKVIN